MIQKLPIMFVLACIGGGCASNGNVESMVLGEPFENLVWADEFDYEGVPDPSKWGYREGGHGWGNQEAQYYTSRSENVHVKEGHLVITARKENFNQASYTSAAVRTYEKQDFLYGRIEVRAKLPGGIGTWPAIWLLGNGVHTGMGWPDCGEIDIMENVGFEPTTVQANIHTQAYNHVKGTQKGDKLHLAQPDEDFHIYAIDWREDRIDFFVDDIRYFSFSKESDEVAVWPFNLPHYLIINLAIGGTWGGQKGIEDSLFPRTYYIDYVRYYQ